MLQRDGGVCRLRGKLGSCNGPLAAHHVIFRSRDPSRRDNVDNGATLCRAHHEWVHANAREARERYGLAGHATDVVSGGRVVMEQITDTGLSLVQLAEALAAARPRRTEP